MISDSDPSNFDHWTRRQDSLSFFLFKGDLNPFQVIHLGVPKPLRDISTLHCGLKTSVIMAELLQWMGLTGLFAPCSRLKDRPYASLGEAGPREFFSAGCARTDPFHALGCRISKRCIFGTRCFIVCKTAILDSSLTLGEMLVSGAHVTPSGD